MKRSKIPPDTADQVLFQSGLKCCVCGNRGHHIHHLDDDPKNHDIGNLAFLCFTCHNEASVSGQLGRKLSAGAIVQFRDDHYARIHSHRRYDNRSGSVPDDDHLYELMYDAVCVREVKKLEYQIGGRAWKDGYPLLLELQSFGDDNGTRLRRTILYVLSGLTSKTRMKMPPPYGEAISTIAHHTLSLWSLRIFTDRCSSEDWAELMGIGSQIGANLAYDAALYTGVFRIVDAGGVLLWRILAFSVVNDLHDLREQVLAHFDTALDGARRGGDPKALALLQLYRAHGFKGESQYPDYPVTLIDRLTEEPRNEWTVS